MIVEQAGAHVDPYEQGSASPCMWKQAICMFDPDLVHVLQYP